MDSRFRTTLFNCLSAALLITGVAMAWRAWPHLPERIPIHFAADGTANGYAPKDHPVAYALVGVPWALTLLLYGISRASRLGQVNPRYVNIPYKDLFVDLPPEQQRPFWQLLTEFYAAMAAALNVLFLSVLSGMLRAAQGKAEGLPPTAVWIPLCVLGLLTAVYSIGIRRVVYRITH